MKLKFQPLTGTHWKHAIKTGIAGALAMFLAERLHLPQSYWVLFTLLVLGTLLFTAGSIILHRWQ